MALTTSVSIGVIASLTNVADLGVVPTAKLDYNTALKLATGTAAGQADKLWFDTRTLAASATEDLDLAGVLTDAFGAVVTFARIKGLVVVAAAGNSNNVVLGAAAANPWTALLGATGTLTVRPGAGVWVFAGAADATGYAVVAGTGDILKVANSAGGTAVTYDIALIGASA